MKLAKKDRERLYKSKGQPITIAWPEEMKDLPRKGKRYTVHGEDGKKAFSVRVVGTHHAKYEVAAEIKIDEDAFKPMIGIGGVRREDGSYETEPERAPDAYVALLCNEAEARNALLQGETVRRRKIERKEQSIASSPRSHRAKERHLRALSRPAQVG